MMNKTLLKQWKKAATDYTLARIRKQNTDDVILEAFNLFKTGKIKLDESRLSFLTRELVCRLQKSATFNALVMADGSLALAIDSAKPRSGDNLAKAVDLLKIASPALKANEIVRITASAVFPKQVGKFWMAKIEQITKVEKSKWKVPDTMKEVFKTASVEGILYGTHGVLKALALTKMIKVNVPEADVSTESRTEPQEHSFSLQIELHKANEEKRLAYGVVYEPDKVDTDGDSAGADAIEQAAHTYLADFSDINLMHQRPLGDKVQVVESYIAPADFALGSQNIRKGSWVMVVRINDDALWQAVKDKKLNAFSIEGIGLAA